MRRPSTLTGITTDAYVKVADINLSGVSNFGLMIKNTGVNDIDVRITSRIASTEYEELGETQITPGSLLRYFEKDIVGYVSVYVKNMTPGSASSYQIEYTM
jgi:hypothetical protein